MNGALTLTTRGRGRVNLPERQAKKARLCAPPRVPDKVKVNEGQWQPKLLDGYNWLRNRAGDPAVLSKLPFPTCPSLDFDGKGMDFWRFMAKNDPGLPVTRPSPCGEGVWDGPVGASPCFYIAEGMYKVGKCIPLFVRGS